MSTEVVYRMCANLIISVSSASTRDTDKVASRMLRGTYTAGPEAVGERFIPLISAVTRESYEATDAHPSASHLRGTNPWL
jgi:hypothetical protein